MVYRIISAGLQDIVEDDDIALDIDIRVIDRLAYAGLGGQVDDDVGLVRFEHLH